MTYAKDPSHLSANNNITVATNYETKNISSMHIISFNTDNATLLFFRTVNLTLEPHSAHALGNMI